MAAGGKTVMHLSVLYKSGNFFSGRETVFLSRTLPSKGGWLPLVIRDVSESFTHTAQQSNNYKRCNCIGQQHSYDQNEIASKAAPCHFISLEQITLPFVHFILPMFTAALSLKKPASVRNLNPFFV